MADNIKRKMISIPIEAYEYYAEEALKLGISLNDYLSDLLIVLYKEEATLALSIDYEATSNESATNEDKQPTYPTKEYKIMRPHRIRN